MTIALDPHDPTFQANPYPVYAQMRDQSPVTKLSPYNSYWVFRSADVIEVVQHTESYTKRSPLPSAPSTTLFGKMGYLPSGLFASDPPRHDMLRGVLEPLFREAIGAAPAVAPAIAASLLEKTSTTGMMEVVVDYAVPLPAGVLFTVLGLDQGDWPLLTQWVGAIAAAHDITQTINAQVFGGTCAMALRTYYEALILRVQASGGPGLLPLLVAKIDGPEGLTREDVISTMTDLTVAGYLSTTFLIGTGLLNLLNNPEQLALLRSQPDLMPSAVEEMLRFDAPAQVVDRYVAVETTLAGVALHPGDKVTAVLGSADHDPDAFAEPDSFMVNRTDSTQMSFGRGIHHCVGAPLARIVTPIAMTALLQLENIAVAGYPQWQTDPYLRGLVNLPVSFSRTRG
ncbi:MAG: hypothetical protein RLZZ623_205 [Actinomycetota bacterium]